MFHHVPKCDFYVHPMRFVFHPVSVLIPFEIIWFIGISEFFDHLDKFIAAKTLPRSLCFAEEARNNSQLPPPDRQHDSHMTWQIESFIF